MSKYLTVRNGTFAVIAVIGLGVYAFVAYRDHSPAPDPAPAGVKIVGPSAASTGDMVVLTVSDATSDSYAWTAVPGGCQQRTAEGGRVSILVFSKPGKHTVVLGTSDNKVVSLAKHTIMVNGDLPPPGPNPNPGPNPGPAPEPEPTPEPEPNGEWATWVYDIAIATVPAPGRNVQAAKLSDQFESIAAKIAAGGIGTTKEARVELRAANRKALGRDAEGWVGFSAKFAEHCTDLEIAGELKTLKQYQRIYAGAAAGLRKVASVSSKAIHGVKMGSTFRTSHKASRKDKKPLVVVITSPDCLPCARLKSEYLMAATLNGPLDDVHLVMMDRSRDAKEIKGIAVTGMRGRIVVPQIHIQRYVDGEWLQFSLTGYSGVAATNKWVRSVFSWTKLKPRSAR